MKIYIYSILIILLYSNLVAQKKEYNEGLKSLNAKNFEEAIKWFTESIKLDPSNADAYQKRGKAQCLLGNYEKAEMDLDECLNRYGENEEARFWKGMVYEAQELYDLAVKQFKKANYSGPYTYFHLGKCYYHISNYKEALYNLNMAIIEKGDYGDAFTYRGLCLLAQNKIELACKEFRDAKLNNDLNADKYLAQYCMTNSNDISIAESYYREGESLEKDLYYKAAIDKYLKAIEYYPDYDAAYYKLARNYSELLNYEEDPRWESDLVIYNKVNPLEYINKAISIKKYLRYYELRGEIYMKLYWNICSEYHNGCDACSDLLYKYQDLAIKDFSIIISNDSTSYVALSNIGWIYYDDYKYEKAIDYFLDALKIFKDKEKKSFDIDIYMGLALSLFYRDRTNGITQKNQYYNVTISNRPDILTGEDGVKTLIKEGYYYSKKQKEDIVKMVLFLKGK